MNITLCTTWSSCQCMNTRTGSWKAESSTTKVRAYVGTRSHLSFFKPVSITTAHGLKDFRGLAAMWGLSSIKSYYHTRQIPNSPYPGLLSYSLRSYDIFKTRYSLCIPSNTCGTQRYTENIHYHPIWSFWITQNTFGLKNTVQTFLSFIDEVLRGLHFSYAYIDDVLVASLSTEEHIRHLWMVLECFKQYGLLVNVFLVSPLWNFLDIKSSH